MIHCPTGSSVRFAYAIPRIVGPAVVRNRVRRRLRAILNELDRQPGGIAPGDYLVRVSQDVAASSYAELEQCLSDAIIAVANHSPFPPKKQLSDEENTS